MTEDGTFWVKVNSLKREEREKKHEQRLVGTLNMHDPLHGPSGGAQEEPVLCVVRLVVEAVGATRCVN